MNLSSYENAEFRRGAGRCKEWLWLMVRGWLFQRSNMPWYACRRAALRRFGASIGRGVVIKPQVKITFPWRLSVGEDAWLGEEVWILNLAPVAIGANVCLSQRVFLCTGNHDWSDPAFPLKTAPIRIEAGAWICAGVFVGPGVTIGRDAVATAGSVVTSDLPAGMVCSGTPCRPVKPRSRRGENAAE